MTRRRLHERALLLALAVLVAASMGCRDPLIPCDPCPDVEGSYMLGSAQAFGDCDFDPFFVDVPLVLSQSGIHTVSSTVINPETDGQTTVVGDLYQPDERDPPGTIAGFSMSGEARVSGLTIMVTLGGVLIVDETEHDELIMEGSVTSMDITPMTATACMTGYSFRAQAMFQ